MKLDLLHKEAYRKLPSRLNSTSPLAYTAQWMLLIKKNHAK